MRSFLRWLGFLPPQQPSLGFTITDNAKAVLLATLKDRPESSRVCISIHVNDPQFEVNFHYEVRVLEDPSKTEFQLGQVNEIPVGVRKADRNLLEGATMDYYEFKGMGGFVWNNPNAPAMPLNE